RFGIAIEQHLCRTVGASVDDVQGIRADPLDANDLDNRRPRHSTYLRPRNDLVQGQHRLRPSAANSTHPLAQGSPDNKSLCPSSPSHEQTLPDRDVWHGVYLLYRGTTWLAVRSPPPSGPPS